MIGLLSRWFIRDRDNVTDPRVRRAYGQLCGRVGIGLNLLLFAGKRCAGAVSGSVAITAGPEKSRIPIIPSATGGWNTSPVSSWRASFF